MTLGLLMPIGAGRSPSAPSASPMGRALLALAAEGIDVILGEHATRGRLTGFRARDDRWEPATAPVVAAYDRFRSVSLPDRYAALRAGLGAVPVANPASLVDLCWDKLACQRHLEARGVRVPPVADGPAAADALAAWGAAFAKPRRGAFGRGVSRLRAGDPIVGDDVIVQRAVPPPPGWAGIAVRALVQREGAAWTLAPLVVRRSATDPVVNVARGAEAVSADVLAAATVDRVVAEAGAAARALADHPDGALLAEVGVDLVIDPDGDAWIVEVNGRPRGRLEQLAAQDPDRFAEAHVAACARPLRFLAGAIRGRAAGA